MIGWIYLAFSSFILFSPNLEWLVTIIPEGIVSIISKIISQSHHFFLLLLQKQKYIRNEIKSETSG
jgi:hypothetical protein